MREKVRKYDEIRAFRVPKIAALETRESWVRPLARRIERGRCWKKREFGRSNKGQHPATIFAKYKREELMRITSKHILRSLSALTFAFGLTACLEAEQGPGGEAEAPQAQVDAPAQEQGAQAQAPAQEPAQVQEKATPEQPAQEKPVEDEQKVQPEAEPEKEEAAEEIIEPEVQAMIPEVLTQDDATRLQAQYEATVEACGEVQTVCIDNGHGEEKCTEINQGCLETAEAMRSGKMTRGGLTSVLKSLIEAVLGVGDAAVSLIRCGSRLIGCALSTLSLHCVPDFAECVVEEVIAK